MTAEALQQEAKRLVQGFRNGPGSTDMLAGAAVDVLQSTWPRAGSISEFAGNELLLELLQSFSVFPVWLERAMTRARLALLFSNPRDELAPLAAALAIQCHLNEYAWNEDPPETERVNGLAADLASLTPLQVMTLACYRPLARLPGADMLVERGWDGPVQKVLYEQIAAVREEAEIAAALPSLTPVRGETSRQVQAQYESNPYPRWRRPNLSRPVTNIHGRQLPAAPRMLIAGCGTGRHAVEATLMLEGTRTLAVDLSRASLAYAVRKTRALGLEDRISYAQADLMDLAGPAQFDIVQSVGVLHHMADPFEGARRVCRLLKPGGLIALGLYSARARAHLKPAQALARTFTPETLRELRQAIINLPQDDPVRAPVVRSLDFYSTSGCRDLLMHVQEHQLTIPDLKRMLDENGLAFMGFHQFFAMQDVRETYLAMFPHDPAGLDLDAWDAFEAEQPRAFGRMYQFWAQKRA